MPSPAKAEKKRAYMEKLVNLVETYPQLLIVNADHVSSRQLAGIRYSLRGKAHVLMGKNTMMRKALKSIPPGSGTENLIPHVKLNIGFVICIADPMEVRGIILNNRVPAPARQGVIAPCDVFVPAGPTGMDPSQTSFFQALGISTKIFKGQIEIQSDVHLIKVNEKVNASSAVLLQKLNIKPFSYGLNVEKVYDRGQLYSASVLDITDEQIMEKISRGINFTSAIARVTGFPTEFSISHSIVEAFKNLVAIGLETDFIFPQMEKIKHAYDNPDAFIAAVSVAPSSAPAAADDNAGKQDEEEDEDDDMGFSLFD
uniref:60S acidic ribosomal protein P0 n=1 Tax=Babesia microti TaxID=5868 RepID=A2PZA4_BABMI|nr:ribosomal phosphoprotein P0 [Babesia microti]